MNEYTVEIAARTAEPLTEEVLERFAELGGVAVGNVGEHRVEITMTIAANEFPNAMLQAIARVRDVAPHELIAVDVMTTEEADRRLAAPQTHVVVPPRLQRQTR